MRPVALVTGLSGVLGGSAAPLLTSSFEVIALTGRRAPQADCEQVTIDLRAPRLGLAPDILALLAKRADVIVHMAGSVDYSASPQQLHAVNEAGAAEMVALAEAADCPLVSVSTAFAARHAQAPREAAAATATSARPAAYHRSKAAADERVRACRGPHTIVRPSIVMGDSRDGSMPELQNMHRMVALLAGGPTAMFGHPDHLVDMVPRDHVARAVHRLAQDAVDGRPLPAEFWATAGPAALTMRQWTQVVVERLARAGRPVAPPLHLDPFEVALTDHPDWDRLPRAARRGMATLWVSTLALAEDHFPTSLTDLDRHDPPHPGRPAHTVDGHGGFDNDRARALFAADVDWLLDRTPMPRPRTQRTTPGPAPHRPTPAHTVRERA
ncbi:SDR family oxidoreductase [Kitasatospora purpeofusca]|uniref:SDR family oxidoreductase n=1 Tax=Kitasatospora purpeofusca TaxID=67352 RepID=UPI0033CCFAF1